MPPTATPDRVRKVTRTEEFQEPIAEEQQKGLGKPWQEYLAGLSADELAITTTYVYRLEPKTSGGFIAKVTEAIDEAWIQERFGGGVYSLAIRTKAGPSAYISRVEIAGEPKSLRGEAAAANPAGAAAPGADAGTMARMCDLLENLVDRLSTGGGHAGAAAAQDSVIEVMSTAAKKAVEIVSPAQTAAANDPLKMMEFAFNLAEKMNRRQDAGGLDADLQRLKLLKEITGGGGDAGLTGLLGQFSTLMELAKKLGFTKGDGAADWKTMLVEKAPEALDTLRDILANRAEASRNDLQRAHLMAGRASLPPARPEIVRTPPAPRVPAEAVPAAASSGLRMTPMGDESTAPPAATGAESEGPVPFTESPQFVQHIKQTIVEMVERGEDGATIVDFLDLNKQGAMAGMLVQFPAAMVTQYLGKDPTLARAVRHPNWQRCLDEARAYISERAAADAEQDPETPKRPN